MSEKELSQTAEVPLVEQLKRIHLGSWATITDPNGWEYSTNIGVLANHAADELTKLLIENTEIWEALVQAVIVLCETRKHEGRRPCKFCYNMHLSRFAVKHPEVKK